MQGRVNRRLTPSPEQKHTTTFSRPDRRPKRRHDKGAWQALDGLEWERRSPVVPLVRNAG
jgi:hypothetical protein